MPANASDALDEAMKDAFPHLFEAAPDLLYQLVTMLSPAQLKQRGVPVHRLVHHEGSFVITFPNAYHAGFNTGIFLALHYCIVFEEKLLLLKLQPTLLTMAHSKLHTQIVT